MMYRDYDNTRFVYETPVGRDLTGAAERACDRSAKSHGYDIVGGFAYRVIDNSYAYVVDAEYDEWGSRTQLEIVAFPVVKVTPTGFRICRGCRGRDEPETRFISEQWTKQWASRTPEDALKSYIARRKRQASIYEGRAAKARSMVREAERLIEEAPVSAFASTEASEALAHPSAEAAGSVVLQPE
jgi:hypothetical protein